MVRLREASSVTPRVVIATILRRRGETGIQAHVQALVDALAARGDTPEFINHLSAFRWLGVPIFVVRRAIDPFSGRLSVWWYRTWHYWFLRLALRGHLRRAGPLVIYAQCPLSARAALDARRSAHQRVVMAVHFSHSQADEWVAKGRIRGDGRVYRAIDRLERETLPRLDGIVYLSDYMRRHIERRHPGIMAVRSETIPNFVTRPRLRQSVADGADLITIGALDTNKNQRYILEVLAEAARMGQGYRLSIVGDGPERAALERMAKTLGITDSVRFLGYRPDARSLLPGHRAYIHAARMDNFPMVLIEALAAGIPVLAPSVGGIPEIFDDGVEGYPIPLDDPAEAARRIIALLEDDAGRCRMGEAARDRFVRDFDADVTATRLIRFLRQAE